MTKQLEALIARAKHIVENGGLLARDSSLQLIEALERAQQSEEVAELLRDKVKRLESDIWDSQQLVKVKSENQYELECKVRELEERNDKSNTAWSRREDAALEKLEATEKRIAELEARKQTPAAQIKWDGTELSVQNVSDGFSYGVTDVYTLAPETSPLAVKLPESFYPDGDIDCPKVVEVEEVIEAIRAAGGTVSEGE